MAVVIMVALSGCLWQRPVVPDDDAWRSGVITAAEETPGVAFTELTVHDVDPGFAYPAPLLQGTIHIEETEDPQTVFDTALRRMSDEIGPQSRGVRIKVQALQDDERTKPWIQYGYEGPGNGSDLWERTR